MSFNAPSKLSNVKQVDGAPALLPVCFEGRCVKATSPSKAWRPKKPKKGQPVTKAGRPVEPCPAVDTIGRRCGCECHDHGW